jgi:hypothetical protein
MRIAANGGRPGISLPVPKDRVVSQDAFFVFIEFLNARYTELTALGMSFTLDDIRAINETPMG